jgi:NAD(P)-dependent dehydrogenase (short-subunit alcohol dehydrogenase family)
MDSQSLKGKLAVVTGASRGIGLAIARVLAREGLSLVLVARNRKLLAEAARRIDGEAWIVAADVTKPADVKRLFATVGRRSKQLDVLVNNAGVFTYKAFERTTLEDWRRNIEANLTSLFLTTQAALPLLDRRRSQASSHVVNILSISSREAFPNCSAYCASKFGALGLTRVLAEELRARRIRVTAVLPGSTNTRMSDEFDFSVDSAHLVQPEDVAKAVLGALLVPGQANVDEVVITPSRGSL